MKKCRTAASLAAVLSATPVCAIEMTESNVPSPAALTQGNLGAAGLVRSYFDSDQFGSVQWRVGQQRLSVGSAATTGIPDHAYRDGTNDTVVPLNFLFGLPDGFSRVRLGVKGTFSNGADYPIELDGQTRRVDLQYLRYPDTATMWAAGVFYEHTDLDIEGAGSIKRPAGGVRGDFLKTFDRHWGISARVEYSWGVSDLKTAAGPNVTLRHKQDDDHLYAQSEFIGQFRHEDLRLIPSGWVAHPILGLQFQRSFIESTADSFGSVSSGVVGSTEDYGTLWTHLRLEKERPVGSWSPNVLVGFEHEYVNDLDAVVQEPNYLVLGAGISMLFDKVNRHRFEISYTRHQGLQNDRWNAAVIGTLTLNFF